MTTSSSCRRQRHPLERQRSACRGTARRARPPRLHAIWSMMPTGAPTNSISARCAMRASATSSSSRLECGSRSARSTATSSAALDDRPLPSGTSESTCRSNPPTRDALLSRAPTSRPGRSRPSPPCRRSRAELGTRTARCRSACSRRARADRRAASQLDASCAAEWPTAARSRRGSRCARRSGSRVRALRRAPHASMSTTTRCSSSTFSSGSVSAVNTPAPISLPARYFSRPGMRYAG